MLASASLLCMGLFSIFWFEGRVGPSDGVPEPQRVAAPALAQEGFA